MPTLKKEIKSIGLFAAFMTPSIILFTTVLLLPFVYGIYLTFTDYNPIAGTLNFVGFDNFVVLQYYRLFPGLSADGQDQSP